MPETQTLWQVLRRTPLLARIGAGAVVSSVGDSLAWTTLIWYLVERTGSGAAVGTMLLCYSLPSVLTAPLLGRWLDRGRMRAITVADNLLRALLVLAVPVLDRAGALPLISVYGLVALLGALTPATRVGLGMLVPRLVPESDRSVANAAISGTESFATVVGPVLAGVLMERGGLGVALGVDAATFLVMAWALAGLPARFDPVAAEAGSAPRARTRDLMTQPVVATVTLLSALFFFSYGPTEAALPLMIKDHLKGSAQSFGMVWSAVGVGALLGALATRSIERRGWTGIGLAVIMALWGVTGVVSAFAPNVPALVLCYFLGGVVWGPYLPLKTTLMQRVVPPDRLGAVLGVQSAFLNPTMPLGAALGGVLLTVLAPQAILAGVGGACIVGAVVGACVPTLRSAR